MGHHPRGHHGHALGAGAYRQEQKWLRDERALPCPPIAGGRCTAGDRRARMRVDAPGQLGYAPVDAA